MRTQAIALKTRLFGSGGTTSSVFGAIGSVHNVCHSLCVTVVSMLAIFGITTQILPLMFLQTYQLYFWLGALVFTGASFYFYLKQRHPRTFDRNLLFINVGLLTFGMPFKQFSDYMDFFRFIGGSLAIIGVFLLLFGKRFRLVNRSIAESEQILSPEESINTTAPYVQKISAFQFPKLTPSSVLFALVIGGFLVNQYLMYRMNVMGSISSTVASTISQMGQAASQMKLTPFDVVLAKERMDKNNDGICDVCGMSIDQCISSGQLNCNMGNNPNAIGVLGSQHIHADFKVYINGQALDFAKPEYYMKSSFMHVDDNQNKEDADSVIHMHAKNVPLWLFFRSLGMNLTKDSLTLADGQVLKNENGNSLKFYLSGKKVDELGDYSFQPLDKLLISFGPENDPDIQRQISSITNFAKDHQK